MAIILANDGIDKSAKLALEQAGYEVDTKKYEGAELLKRLPEVDCVLVRSATQIRNPQIDAGATGKLKLIIRAGVGIDNINADYAKEKGMTVQNTPSASSNAVAELALAQMFCLARHLHRSNRSMAAGQWLKKEYEGSELMGKTLGIVGMGRIGTSLATKAQALGMRVVYNDLFTTNPDFEAVDFAELLRVSDFVSLHIPSQDKAILGKEEIAQMKDGAFIINLARGGVVDEEALLEALASGKIRGAALDCFCKEPLANEAIMQADRLSLTPHIGAATVEAQARIGDVTVELIQAFFKE